MTTFPASIVAPAINHLLRSESWALARLLPFAGQSVRIIAPPLDLLLSVSPEGSLQAVDASKITPEVTITFPGDLAFKAIGGDQAAVLAAARLSGSADFAEALAFVFRNLRWDAEADLAALIGDIPAHRGFAALRSFLNWQRSTVLNVAHNIKEYVTEESQQVMTQRDIGDFGRAVNALRDGLARLEKRISQL